jgi:formylglycine-generating enzyme required for sulfatase activity
MSRHYAPGPVPSLEEFESLWTAWDIATKSMIPQEELLSRPIRLRNCLVFYLGHIPTFLGKYSSPLIMSCSNKTDIHITRATRGSPTEPKSYPLIFERGIDPDVDNPEQCHAHSELPKEWPSVGEISNFQESVRNRVRHILKQGMQKNDRSLSEALWIGFEHEALHLETFLYMLLQSEKTLPPLGVVTPDFKRMASEAKTNAVSNEWFTVPQTRILIGLDDDPDCGRVPNHSFGWDNEKPPRAADVPAFSARGRPITNAEYAAYLEQNRISSIPSSWETKSTGPTGSTEVKSTNPTQTNGIRNTIPSAEYLNGLSIRTVFGLIPLEFCLDWPVMASYNELAAYAEWMNCRIPNFEEVKSLYKHSAELKSDGIRSFGNGNRLVNIQLSSEIC